MGKIKTHRGAAKRFSLTKSGKVKKPALTEDTFLPRNQQREKEH